MKPRIDWEARFRVALRRITAYMSTDQLRRRSEKQYGLSYEEALEMAYENVLGEAQHALKGYRPKRAQAPRGTQEGSMTEANDETPAETTETIPPATDQAEGSAEPIREDAETGSAKGE